MSRARESPRNHLSDLHGASRLAIAATTGITDLVEAMHGTIVRTPGVLGKPDERGTNGITGVVYDGIRGVTRLVGAGVDAALGQLAPLLGDQATSPGRETVLAALNGVLGDYLEETGNPLAIRMSLRRRGVQLPLERQALAAAMPQATGKLLVLVHGLCMNDLQWNREGHDHGEALARELGFTPVCVHYNTGLHVSTNGRRLAELLELLVGQWPVPVDQFAMVAHSMGGLVSHSAVHYGNAAGHAWPKRLGTVVFLGTPHHGAPLERGGHAVDVTLGLSPYTAPFTRLGRIRSAGITDLRHGYLLDDDWRAHARLAGSRLRRHPVPLPANVRCYAIAATTARKSAGLHARLVGDGLVPVTSALGRHDDSRLDLAIPPERQRVIYETGHLGLLDSPQVYATLAEWLR
jgi:PGAP1-like protein